MKSQFIRLTLFCSLLFGSSVHATNEFGDNISEIQFNEAIQVFDSLVESLAASSRDSVCFQSSEGSFQVSFVGGEEAATALQLTITNLSIFQALGIAGSPQPKDLTNYVRNYAYFELFDTTGQASGDTLNVHYDLSFGLTDPPGSSLGGVAFSSIFTVKDVNGASFIDENGAASLHVDGPSSQVPVFSGFYANSGMSTDDGGGAFSNSLDETFQSTVPLDTTLEIFSETFADILLSSIDETDTSTWEVDSSNTLVINITALNPNVRFRRIQKDIVTQPDGILNGKGQNLILNKPNRRQTVKATVSGKKKFTWRIENDGPDQTAAGGDRTILAKGPRNSSRLRFAYRNNGRNVTAQVNRGRFTLPPKKSGEAEVIIVEAQPKKKKKFGKRRQESFNLTARSPSGLRDVARLQLITN